MSVPDAGRDDDRSVRTEAEPMRSRWPGLVWAVPLAALLIVAYLGFNAYANQGVDAVVTFHTSGGAKAGDTPVVYKGVTVGRVVKIEINHHDISHVDMTLRLEARAKPALRQGAKFWLIGAQTSLFDVSALKAVVSGVSIGLSPGHGRPTRRFLGVDTAPPVPPDTPGRFFRLHSATIGSLPVGAGVYYHGVLVGHVTVADVRGPDDFEFGAFIVAPYDRLVRPGTVFSSVRALDLDLSNRGLTAQIGPGDSLLRGGVDLVDPAATLGQPEAEEGTSYTLYPTGRAADDQPDGPEIAYEARFRAAPALPAADAPVLMGGVRIGRVISSEQGLRVGETAPVTRVRLEIEPRRLRLSGWSGASVADGRAATDAALAGLVRGGYRLRLAQTPPLVGPQALVLAQEAGVRGGRLQPGADGETELPTAAGGDLSAITDRTVAILDKVNRIPLTAIGSDVRAITGRLRQLVTSPQLSDGLDHLDSTLRQVDGMVTEVKPQVGPLIGKLDAAADQLQALAASANGVLSEDGPQDANLPAAVRQLTEAARSIRSLADYLGRHPEAVIRGKARTP
jgi:paraquat-inducible protein B